MTSSSGVAGPCRGRRVEGESSVGSPRHGWGCGLCGDRCVEGVSSVGSPRNVRCVGQVGVVGLGRAGAAGASGVVGSVGAVVWTGAVGGWSSAHPGDVSGEIGRAHV